MTFGSHHAALFAEYKSLMDEETTLWTVIGEQLAAHERDAAAAQPSAADMARWQVVRARRARLDQIIDALAAPRESGWADLGER